jgi:hypothetical protein
MRRPEPKNIKSRTKRAVTRLDWLLEKRLLSYVAAASAAGVGTLCCTPQAQAKVVFTDTWIPMGPGPMVTQLDLNNDGIADFQISNAYGCSKYSTCVTMKVRPQNASNAVWGTNRSASVLGSGVKLGSRGKFQRGHEFMARELVFESAARYRSSGQWKQTTRGFLGLKFIIQGQVHFGWARLSVSATTRGMYGAISGYAYETEPNTPITTGQENSAAKKKSQKRKNSHVSPAASTLTESPGSLGMLAGGAPVLMKRRDEMQPINNQGGQ